LLKKASECLLCFAGFLMEREGSGRAVEVLLLALRNESSLATLLAHRLRHKQKREAKAMRAELHHRLHAALFNLAQCCHAQQLLPHSYYFLAQTHLLTPTPHPELNTHPELKTHLSSFLLTLKQVYQQHRELDVIASAYFTLSDLDRKSGEKKVRAGQLCKEVPKEEASLRH
jgi:hypothetical protein